MAKRDYLSDGRGLQEAQGRTRPYALGGASGYIGGHCRSTRQGRPVGKRRIRRGPGSTGTARNAYRQNGRYHCQCAYHHESKVDKSKVQILSRVTLLNHNTGKEVIYTIVAEHEANLREGKLAIGTPIAKALLGHKKGDRVDVTVPAGTIHFEILDINI